jgi:hypothetical protein
MRPPPRRWIVLAGTLACSGGCAAPGARTFAVVLEEPEYLDCAVEKVTADAPTDLAANYFSSVVTDWRWRWDAGLLRPTGGRLNLVRHGDRMRAWLEGLAVGQYQLLTGIVFEGEPHDGYVDVDYVASHDTEQEDCGELVDQQSELLATVDGGEIEGRIRRVEYAYFSSSSSACAAIVECARNIAVYGSEAP